jgi:hypothetical protein
MLFGAFQSPSPHRAAPPPEFKDLAQTWGWKMITVREKMYVTIKCVSQQILFSGFGG